jgi:large subunit ribosomal protein L10
MEGSIKVTEDSHVLDAGETVSEDLSNVLSELGIEPKEVGLDLRAVYADGVLFTPDELAIDVDDYRDDVQAAAAAARNLSVNAAYPTTRTAGTLLAKAAGEAKALGLAAAIENEELVPDLIARADAQLRALAAHIDDEEALPEELRGVEPAATEEPEAADEDEQDDEEDSAAEDADADDEEDDSDDDGDAGDGLGAMFG